MYETSAGKFSRRVKPSGLLSLIRPTGSRTEERPMRVNDRLRIEFMAECLGKRPAFLMQERPWSPSLSTNLPERHSVLLKILASVCRAIAIRSSSGLSRFLTLAIGKASDQAVVWLFCAVFTFHCTENPHRCLVRILWWQIVWCWNISSLCQLYTISCYVQPTSISNCTFPFEHIPSSHSHLYSILLTLLYILPLLTQLGCVYLPRFWLFCLWIYDLVFLCIFVFWFSRCCWFSFVLQEQHVFPSIHTYHFWRTKKFEGNTFTDWIPRVPNQPSSKCKKHCKQFVELARCERVMTT